MSELTYDDVELYESFFNLVPPFILERMAKRNSNLVSKFKSNIQSHLNTLTDDQRNKLEIVLNSDVGDLQNLMDEAYRKTGKKQYKILSNPKYKEFVENNIGEIRKMVD